MEYWVDITPANMILPEYTLFRHVELGYSFLRLPDGRYLRLGETTEGCGVVNGVFADLDANDQPELVYTYTAEAEDGPAARVGWLDLTTLENRSAALRKTTAGSCSTGPIFPPPNPGASTPSTLSPPWASSWSVTARYFWR